MNTRTLSLKKFLALFFGFILTVSCTHSGGKRSALRKVTDMAGRTMEVPLEIKRVYVDRPGSLLLYAVAPRLMVARTLGLSDSSRPFLDSDYLALPYTDGSTEEILKLAPDVIISCFDINKRTTDQADRLADQTGIPVFQVEIDMNSYPETFKALGDLLGRREQTSRMEAFVHAYLDTIAMRAKRVPAEKKIKVYYAEGDCGLTTDPSGSKHSQVIDFVGAENVARIDIFPGAGMSPVSMEQILKWDPEVILCWTGMKGTYRYILSDEIWETTRAVKNKAVYQIPYLPFGWFDRPPGTNRIIGTIWTARLLYPDIFPYDMQKITREYFRIFYHHELTEKELAKF